MMTGIRVISCCWLLGVGLLGCNEASPPATEALDHQTQYVPPPDFKGLSHEAAKQRQKETPVAEVARPETEIPPERPRHKTVLESLFQAVRNGAAEAMDEDHADR